jgi:hypothetical protein
MDAFGASEGAHQTLDRLANLLRVPQEVRRHKAARAAKVLPANVE